MTRPKIKAALITDTTETVEPTVTVSPEDARQILSLHRTVESAERNFKKCQSDLFRRFVVETAEARNVSAAFARLGEALEAEAQRAGRPEKTEETKETEEKA